MFLGFDPRCLLASRAGPGAWNPLCWGKDLSVTGTVGLPCDAPARDVCDRLGFMRRKCRRMMAFTTERMYVVKVEDGRAKASFPIKSVVLAPSDKVNQVLYLEGKLDLRPSASGVVPPVSPERFWIDLNKGLSCSNLMSCLRVNRRSPTVKTLVSTREYDINQGFPFECLVPPREIQVKRPGRCPNWCGVAIS